MWRDLQRLHVADKYCWLANVIWHLEAYIDYSYSVAQQAATFTDCNTLQILKNIKFYDV